MAGEKKNDERRQRDQREHTVVAAKETPRRARVAPVNELEESFDDDLFVHQSEKVEHHGLGDLVQRHHKQREHRDAAVGRAEQCADEFHYGGTAAKFG